MTPEAAVAVLLIAALRVFARRFPMRALLLGSVGIVFGLGWLIWLAKLTWFAPVSQQIKDHGRPAEAKVLSMSDGQSDGTSDLIAHVEFRTSSGVVHAQFHTPIIA